MSLIIKNALQKHMAAARATAGISICVVLSACGSGLPTPNVSESSSSGNANLVLQVDPWLNGTWDDISTGASYDLNCDNGVSDYKLRLLNTGAGSLTASGSAVSISKSSDYTGGPMNGSSGDFTFSIQSQPSMPVGPNSSAEFTVRLTNSNGDCMLGGVGYNHEGLETALVTITTDDPTNPTYSATLRVKGNS